MAEAMSNPSFHDEPCSDVSTPDKFAGSAHPCRICRPPCNLVPTSVRCSLLRRFDYSLEALERDGVVSPREVRIRDFGRYPHGAR